MCLLGFWATVCYLESKSWLFVDARTSKVNVWELYRSRGPAAYVTPCDIEKSACLSPWLSPASIFQYVFVMFSDSAQHSEFTNQFSLGTWDISDITFAVMIFYHKRTLLIAVWVTFLAMLCWCLWSVLADMSVCRPAGNHMFLFPPVNCIPCQQRHDPPSSSNKQIRSTIVLILT